MTYLLNAILITITVAGNFSGAFGIVVSVTMTRVPLKRRESTIIFSAFSMFARYAFAFALARIFVLCPSENIFFQRFFFFTVNFALEICTIRSRAVLIAARVFANLSYVRDRFVLEISRSFEIVLNEIPFFRTSRLVPIQKLENERDERSNRCSSSGN